MAERSIIANTTLSGPGVELNEIVEKGIIDIDFNYLKILDIGFNDPGSFILLHHLYGLGEYIGIDTNESNKFHINISFGKYAPIPEEMVSSGDSTPFDRYKLFYKYVLTQIPGKEINMLNRADFERIFQFKFETSVQDYVVADALSKYRPNLLVLSNILHLIEDKNEAHSVYTSLLDQVSEKGLIWLKIYNSKNPGNSGRFPYSISDINNIKSEIDCIYEEEQNDKTLIVGRKRSIPYSG